MRIVKLSKRFKREYDLAQSRGKNISKLDIAIFSLAMDGCLPQGYKDHALKGELEGFRDCHIEPDWLLLYAIEDDELYLSRTGTHADLFGD
jgi:mRNA interferase YafQ